MGEGHPIKGEGGRSTNNREENQSAMAGVSGEGQPETMKGVAQPMAGVERVIRQQGVEDQPTHVWPGERRVNQ